MSLVFLRFSPIVCMCDLFSLLDQFRFVFMITSILKNS